jgi:hypothetical protein
MSWEDILKMPRKRCSWCGHPKGWNGKDCISCNRGDFKDEELVETHSEMSDEEKERLQ